MSSTVKVINKKNDLSCLQTCSGLKETWICSRLDPESRNVMRFDFLLRFWDDTKSMPWRIWQICFMYSLFFTMRTLNENVQASFIHTSKSELVLIVDAPVVKWTIARQIIWTLICCDPLEVTNTGFRKTLDRSGRCAIYVFIEHINNSMWNISADQGPDTVEQQQHAGAVDESLEQVVDTKKRKVYLVVWRI